ncbi:hypothetical protein GCM10022225_76040 [Plantactinospora mayteni]|uniref:Uncharacterized protein n=1 Tax=Plantactinospora mayteni TaxID=566021 RepID=A0ABQ4F202_9ACTN|nr:hypothetical protein [Plantactinospora mayteni]GIH00902.1 hypothetical protein Pma05_74740 [Plantactinospora mayteni]
MTRLRDTWTGIGQPWERLLQEMTVSYPDDIVAILHRHEVHWQGWWADPHARIEAGELDRLVGRVPAAMRPVLAERERELIGLVLADERVRNFDAARCGLLLRNLLTSLGVPELTNHVIVEDTAATGAEELDGQEAEEPVVRLHWQQTGLGSGTFGAGLTRQQCLPALLAAAEGKTLATSNGGARGRRRRATS